MVENILLCRERAHTVAKQDKWLFRILVPGDAAQLSHIFHEQVETTFAEISKASRGERCATVSTMIVCVNRYPDGNQSFDQARVAAEVLTHPMRDLNDAAHRSLAIPPGRRHVQT